MIRIIQIEGCFARFRRQASARIAYSEIRTVVFRDFCYIYRHAFIEQHVTAWSPTACDRNKFLFLFYTFADISGREYSS